MSFEFFNIFCFWKAVDAHHSFNNFVKSFIGEFRRGDVEIGNHFVLNLGQRNGWEDSFLAFSGIGSSRHGWNYHCEFRKLGAFAF